VERLYRSSSERMVAGVCGGFGEYFGIDPTVVRVIFVLATIVTAFLLGIAAYLALWLIIPSEESLSGTTRESMRKNVEEIAQSARDLGSEVQATLSGGKKAEASHRERLSLVGLVLVIVGILFLTGNLNPLGWLHWDKLWALAIIGVGLFLLWRRR
jgi:phage shock protein C